MPVLHTLRKLVCCARRQQDEPEAPARQPLPLPVETEFSAAGPGEPGRPYRDFVENEARKYWAEMTQAGGLKKPGRKELRRAAMPILGKALRRRQGAPPEPGLAHYRARQAVNAMQDHAIARGWIRPPYAQLAEYATHADALLQLADDAGWLYREIPLQKHPGPQHPPIHYTIDPVSKRPVPTEDSLIRADYVYDPLTGSRISQAEHIPPWRKPGDKPTRQDLTSRGWDACYKFSTSRIHSWDRPWDAQVEKFYLVYSWIDPVNLPQFLFRCDRNMGLGLPFTDHTLDSIHFSPHPPTAEQVAIFRWKVNLLFRLNI